LKSIPPKQELYLNSVYYCKTEDGIYFYDRYWEDFSHITGDSVALLFEFDLKQRIPLEERIKEIPDKLELYSFINYFAHSKRYLLLNYINFDRTPSFWVLFDKADNKTLVSRRLVNDLTEGQLSSGNLFYIDDYTWCRVLNNKDENDTSINMEFIHLKRTSLAGYGNSFETL
jgi:hypothetical protein